MDERYTVVFRPDADRDLARLDPPVARRIRGKAVSELSRDPYPRGDVVKRLEGFHTATFRLRVAKDYRVIFRISERIVRVLRVVHRSDLDRELRG